MSKMKRARAMFIASAVVFGTLGLFVRKISVSSGELALYRAVIAALLLAGYLLVTRQLPDFRAIRRQIPLLLLSGVAMSCDWIFLFESYKHTTVSVATLSYYFAPVIVTVACPILFKEKMGVKRWICFLMSTLGIVLITGTSDLGGGNLTGILLALCAAVFYAVVILLNKLIKDVPDIQRTLLQFLAAIVVLVPYVACTGGSTLGSLDGIGWACLLTVGLFHTGFTYCLYFSGLKELPGQEIAVLSYIDPLVAVLCSVLLLHEQMTFQQILGGAFILGFTLWNEITPDK